MNNKNKLYKKWIAVLSVSIFGTLVFSIFNHHAYAVSTEAKDACKSQKNSATKAACGFGFDTIINNTSQKARNVCSKYKVKENNKACTKGVSAGRSEAKKQLAASGATVHLPDGTDSSITPCGDGPDQVHLRIDLGCQGDEYDGPGGAIGDLLFSIIRFLSVGVGVVVVIAIIASGIQYTMGEGNPEVTQQAKGRIRASLMSLVVYMFIFAIAQFLIPGGFFN